MKNVKLHNKSGGLRLLLGLAVAGALLFASCQDVFNTLGSAREEAYGKVSVDLGDLAESNARTLLPPLNNDAGTLTAYNRNFMEYEFKRNGAVVEYSTETVNTVKYYILPVGTYTLSVKVYDKDPSNPANTDKKQIAEGATSGTFTVSQNVVMSVKVTLGPVNLGKDGYEGFFKFMISYPKTINSVTVASDYTVVLEELKADGTIGTYTAPSSPADRLTTVYTDSTGPMKITSLSSSNSSAPATTFDGPGWKLPSGSYLFTVRIYYVDGSYWGITQAVLIYPQKTTEYGTKTDPINIAESDLVGISDEADAIRVLKEGLNAWITNKEALAEPVSDSSFNDTDKRVTLYYLATTLTSSSFPLTGKGGWGWDSSNSNGNIDLTKTTDLKLAFTNGKAPPLKIEANYNLRVIPVAKYVITVDKSAAEDTAYPSGSGATAAPTFAYVSAKTDQVVPGFSITKDYKGEPLIGSLTGRALPATGTNPAGPAVLTVGWANAINANASLYLPAVPAQTNVGVTVVGDGEPLSGALGVVGDVVNGVTLTSGFISVASGTTRQYNFDGLVESKVYNITIHRRVGLQERDAVANLGASLKNWVTQDDVLARNRSNPQVYHSANYAVLHYVHSQINPKNKEAPAPFPIVLKDNWEFKSPNLTVNTPMALSNKKLISCRLSTGDYIKEFILYLNPVAEIAFKYGPNVQPANNRSVTFVSTLDPDGTKFVTPGTGGNTAFPGNNTYPDGYAGIWIEAVGSTYLQATGDFNFNVIPVIDFILTPDVGAAIMISKDGDDITEDAYNDGVSVGSDSTSDSTLRKSYKILDTASNPSGDNVVGSSRYEVVIYESLKTQVEAARLIVKGQPAALVDHVAWVKEDAPNVPSKSLLSDSDVKIKRGPGTGTATRNDFTFSEIYYADDTNVPELIDLLGRDVEKEGKAPFNILKPNPDDATDKDGRYWEIVDISDPTANADTVLSFQYLTNGAGLQEVYQIKMHPVVQYTLDFSSAGSMIAYGSIAGRTNWVTILAEDDPITNPNSGTPAPTNFPQFANETATNKNKFIANFEPGHIKFTLTQHSTDPDIHQIQVFDATGIRQTFFASAGTNAYRFGDPDDDTDGVDPGKYTVRVYLSENAQKANAYNRMTTVNPSQAALGWFSDAADTKWGIPNITRTVAGGWDPGSSQGTKAELALNYAQVAAPTLTNTPTNLSTLPGWKIDATGAPIYTVKFTPFTTFGSATVADIGEVTLTPVVQFNLKQGFKVGNSGALSTGTVQVGGSNSNLLSTNPSSPNVVNAVANVDLISDNPFTVGPETNPTKKSAKDAGTGKYKVSFTATTDFASVRDFDVTVYPSVEEQTALAIANLRANINSWVKDPRKSTVKPIDHPNTNTGAPDFTNIYYVWRDPKLMENGSDIGVAANFAMDKSVFTLSTAFVNSTNYNAIYGLNQSDSARAKNTGWVFTEAAWQGLTVNNKQPKPVLLRYPFRGVEYPDASQTKGTHYAEYTVNLEPIIEYTVVFATTATGSVTIGRREYANVANTPKWVNEQTISNTASGTRGWAKVVDRLDNSTTLSLVPNLGAYQFNVTYKAAPGTPGDSWLNAAESVPGDPTEYTITGDLSRDYTITVFTN